MESNFTDADAYRRAKSTAQSKANRLGERVAFGYCSYSGWTHVDITDVYAIAELGDVVAIDPAPEPLVVSN
ncbi:MAG: hypothetical protein EOO52_13355 [Gammaproteobacteria bacterium]|nr:MAG: hypothetical protein EOO52_13355 [Gammaproteobacteria bacterium]